MVLDKADEAKFAAGLIARLPDRIRVGAYEFYIERFSHAAAAAARRYGECSGVEQRISIQEWMPSRYKAVDTVMHEISHALFWAYGVLDADDEERTVGLTASGWMALYRDNPWLLDWLKSAEL